MIVDGATTARVRLRRLRASVPCWGRADANPAAPSAGSV